MSKIQNLKATTFVVLLLTQTLVLPAAQAGCTKDWKSTVRAHLDGGHRIQRVMQVAIQGGTALIRVDGKRVLGFPVGQDVPEGRARIQVRKRDRSGYFLDIIPLGETYPFPSQSRRNTQLTIRI